MTWSGCPSETSDIFRLPFLIGFYLINTCTVKCVQQIQSLRSNRTERTEPTRWVPAGTLSLATGHTVGQSCKHYACFLMKILVFSRYLVFKLQIVFGGREIKGIEVGWYMKGKEVSGVQDNCICVSLTHWFLNYMSNCILTKWEITCVSSDYAFIGRQRKPLTLSACLCFCGCTCSTQFWKYGLRWLIFVWLVHNDTHQ